MPGSVARAPSASSPTEPALTPRRPGKMFGPRCLAPLLDVRPGQTVLFLGHHKTLARGVERRGARALSVVFSEPKAGQDDKERIHLNSPSQALPLPNACVDHLVAASVNTGWWTLDRLGELARVMSPGATLLIGADARLRFPLRPKAQTPGRGRHLLAAAGFTDTHVYGVRHGFHDPRFLVSLGHPGARTWFFSSAYPPQNSRQARLVALLSRMPRTGLDQVYFPNLLFVGIRERGPGC